MPEEPRPERGRLARSSEWLQRNWVYPATAEGVSAGIVINILVYSWVGRVPFIDFLSAEGTFALAVAALTTILVDRSDRIRAERFNRKDRREDLEYRIVERTPHLQLKSVSRDRSRTNLVQGGRQDPFEAHILRLKNVGPGIARDVSVSIDYFGVDFRMFDPSTVEGPLDKPAIRRMDETGPLRQTWVESYLSPGEEIELLDPEEETRPDRWPAGPLVFLDTEVVEARVQVSYSDLEGRVQDPVRGVFRKALRCGQPAECVDYEQRYQSVSAWSLNLILETDPEA